MEVITTRACKVSAAILNANRTDRPFRGVVMVDVRVVVEHEEGMDPNTQMVRVYFSASDHHPVDCPEWLELKDSCYEVPTLTQEQVLDILDKSVDRLCLGFSLSN